MRDAHAGARMREAQGDAHAGARTQEAQGDAQGGWMPVRERVCGPMRVVFC